MKEEEKLPLIIIGARDEDADWIMTPEKRKKEIAIHDQLAERHKKRKEK